MLDLANEMEIEDINLIELNRETYYKKLQKI